MNIDIEYKKAKRDLVIVYILAGLILAVTFGYIVAVAAHQHRCAILQTTQIEKLTNEQIKYLATRCY